MITLGMLLLATVCQVNARTTTKVDELFTEWNDGDSPGAALVIVKDGAIIYQQGYGYANLEHRIRITPQTAFDVASVAKQFTGLSVAMLVEQGKLSLDDDIRKYLPDVPDFGKPITLAHLLHHTSGLRDWPETLALSGVDLEGPITLEMILEMVRRQRELDFAPGEEEQYSNTGYNLLAAAVAKDTGQSFGGWTDVNLFQPLGMNHTRVCVDPAEVVTNRADSYAPGDQGKFHRVESQLAAQGSSSLFVTAEDMGKWLLNFETAHVGGKAALQMIREPGKLTSGMKVNYGFGLVLGDYQGSPMFNHGGSWAGYRSFVMWIPEKRFAVAILSNAADMNASNLSFRVADLYLGVPADERPIPPVAKTPNAVKGDPTTWDAFLGTYRLGPGWLLTITLEGDRLMAQATHEDKFNMTPISNARFFVKAYGAAVEFVHEDSGPVTHLHYRGINAPKLNVSSPTGLADYAGDYWSEELRTNARFEIHDGQLAIQRLSGAWMNLLRTGENRFDAERTGFAVEFTRNAASEVTEVKVSGGRVRHIRYQRVQLADTKTR